jgi:PAS domain S-box-containing protein
MEVIHKDGSIRWIKNTPSLRYDDCGNLIAYESMVNDITERKLVEEALWNASLYSRSLIEASLDPLVTISAEGRITDVNTATEKITGKDRETLIGSDFVDYFTEPDMARAGYLKVFEQGKVTDYPLAIRHTSGAITDVLYNASVYRNEQGEVLGVLAAARDITVRKHADDALRDSEERLRRVIEHTNAGYFRIDRAGNFQQVNNAWLKMHGYESSDDVIGKHFSLTQRETDLEEAQRNVALLLAGGSISSGEFSRRCRDGSVRYHTFSAHPIFYGTEIAGVEGFIIDITERKRMEAVMKARLRLLQLADSQSLTELLQATLDEVESLTGSQIGFYHFMESDHVTLLLQTLSTNTLQTMCRAEGSGNHYFVDHMKAWVDCIYENRPVIHNDYSSLPHLKGLQDGQLSIIRELIVPVMRSDVIMAVLGIGNKPTDYNEQDIETVASLADLAWDIAERKRAEEYLRDSEERYRVFINSTDDMACLKDNNFRYLLVNRANAAFFGKEEAEILGKTDFDLIPEKAAQICHETDLKVFASDEVVIAEELVGGRIYETHKFKVPLKDSTYGIGCYIKDITDRKKFEEKIKSSLAEKEILLREIHHRVKNNMQVISSLLNLQADKTKDTKYNDIISESINRINSMALIHNLLYQSENLSEINFKYYVSELCNSLLSIYNLPERRINITYDIEKIELKIDTAIPCGLIINELVSNSLKHAFPSALSGDITISVKKRKSGTIQLSVHDNGVGLPEDMDIKKINSLGLQLVSLLTKQLNGKLIIKSVNGTIAIITFKDEL